MPFWLQAVSSGWGQLCTESYRVIERKQYSWPFALIKAPTCIFHSIVTNFRICFFACICTWLPWSRSLLKPRTGWNDGRTFHSAYQNIEWSASSVSCLTDPDCGLVLNQTWLPYFEWTHDISISLQFLIPSYLSLSLSLVLCTFSSFSWRRSTDRNCSCLFYAMLKKDHCSQHSNEPPQH